MVNLQNIINFIDYGYQPYNRKQCIKRTMLIWLLSFGTSYIGESKLFWMILFSTINIIVCFIFCFVDFKFRHLKLSRFICDGITYLYISIILNLSSYKFFTLYRQQSWYMCIALLILLTLSIIFSLIVIIKSIKSNKYSKQQNDKKMFAFALVGSVCGFCTAHFLLPGTSQDTTIMLVGIILLVLSFIIGIGSINLLKAFLYSKIN